MCEGVCWGQREHPNSKVLQTISLRSNAACHLHVNQVLLEHSHTLCLPSVYGFQTTTAETTICDRPYGPQGLKYLLSGPFQKKFANPCLMGCKWDFHGGRGGQEKTLNNEENKSAS